MNRDTTLKHFEDICNSIETSKRGVTYFCNKNTISEETFYRLLKEDNKHYERYTRAKERQYEYLGNMMTEKAFELTELIMRGEGGENVHALVNAVRLEIDTLKWLLSKLIPKKYGDKQTVEHEGGVGITWVENRTDKKPE